MSELPALGDHIGYRLRQLSNHVSQSFARKLAQTGVTGAEWAMMRLLYGAAPMASSALAERMGMTKGAISRLVDRLEEKGLVAREAGEDARVRMLSLTARGTELVPTLSALAEANEAECFAHLWDEEKAILNMLLDRLVDRLKLTGVPVD